MARWYAINIKLQVKEVKRTFPLNQPLHYDLKHVSERVLGLKTIECFWELKAKSLQKQIQVQTLCQQNP